MALQHDVGVPRTLDDLVFSSPPPLSPTEASSPSDGETYRPSPPVTSPRRRDRARAPPSARSKKRHRRRSTPSTCEGDTQPILAQAEKEKRTPGRPRAVKPLGRPSGISGGQGSTGASGESTVRSTGSWKKEEVRALWNAVGLVPAKVSWEQVAARVQGRDKLSCSNKWRYDLLPKIQEFIDGLGD